MNALSDPGGHFLVPLNVVLEKVEKVDEILCENFRLPEHARR
jgi:hypothetical protein